MLYYRWGRLHLFCINHSTVYERLTTIAVRIISDFLITNKTPSRVHIICQDWMIASAFQEALYAEFLRCK